MWASLLLIAPLLTKKRIPGFSGKVIDRYEQMFYNME